ncbi:MAG: hypothetical protein OXH13_07695 [Chloroflexi bacterium]|nr:hypothetical protein [Chloroflexota bacterium]MCY3697439.1 hypothetical protein [Chloroflexota bacterium]MXX33037.1 hypothetical protein [Chloroflexota bacterium]MXX81154.1 hypothetical protein [Chloroflexota bacterium]MYB22766.1 hypothetical protein [Chloroflexota bacterium]
MPPLVTHMIAAVRTGGQIDADGLQLDRSNGEYLLGATTPDIRVLTRWDRERTHFFDIYDDGHQDCVENFFSAHRLFRDPSHLSPETQAWVAGYLSHVIMDQEYVLQIYRPFFGSRSLLGGGSHANLLDRVLQYELDRREREASGEMQHLRRALFGSAVEIDAGFVDRGLLEQWRDTTAAMTEHPPDWERFSFIASRHLKSAGIESEAGLREFMDTIPELLDDTLSRVDQAALDGFFESTTQRTASVLREWLGAA